MSIKKLADSAIEWLNERIESHPDSRCASEGEVYMAAMVCRIQELEAALESIKDQAGEMCEYLTEDDMDIEGSIMDIADGALGIGE